MLRLPFKFQGSVVNKLQSWFAEVANVPRLNTDPSCCVFFRPALRHETLTSLECTVEVASAF